MQAEFAPNAKSDAPAPAASQPGAWPCERLGRNAGAYCGENIDVLLLLSEVRELARAHGWQLDVFGKSGDAELLGLRRPGTQPGRNIYISAGIHGDEPAGPLAVRHLISENRWPECANLWLCPCLNPGGFALGNRECALGTDLNRDYRNPRTAEVRAHVQWLAGQPRFDLCLCLHEDWEAHGFYLYELNPEHRPSLASHIVEAVRPVCPIDHSTLIDGREAKSGIIRPELNPATRPDWPEAYYLITHKANLSYTLEAPSDFSLHMRAAALAAATRRALDVVCAWDAIPAGRENNC